MAVTTSNIRRGTSTPSAIYRGTSLVKKIYRGTSLVWEVQESLLEQYLTVTCIAAGTIKFGNPNLDGRGNTIYYSKNQGSWTSVTFSTSSPPSVSMSVGDSLRLKGTNSYYDGDCIYLYSGKYDLSGNIMSLIGGDSFSTLDDLGHEDTFCHLFENGEINDASNLKLPATKLTSYCYQDLFRDSTIEVPPAFPTDRISASSGESLNACFMRMYYGCTQLDYCPSFPWFSSDSIPSYGYYQTFYGCTSLTSVPSMTINEGVGSYGCYEMFRGCTGITTTNGFIDTRSTSSYCYYRMFYGCTSLTSSPGVLVTNNTAAYCCYEMFRGCTNLTNIYVSLGASTLSNYCYYGMFYGCSKITTAPELPATTLVNNCYSYMFYNCSLLNQITAKFTTTPGTSYTNNWVYGVASSGTFTKSPNASWTTTGVHGVPTGWTTVTGDPDNSDCLKIYFATSGWFKWNATASSIAKTIYYKVGSGNFTSLTASTSASSISVSSGVTVYIYGRNNSYSRYDEDENNYFSFSGNVHVFGKLSALHVSTSPDSWAYAGMFRGCTTLKSLKNPNDSSETLTFITASCNEGQYFHMFHGCTGLTWAGVTLPSWNNERAYEGMFYGCTSLTTIPSSMPYSGGNLREDCYNSMFYNCSSITTAPTFPTTIYELESNCCERMFYGCINLRTTPTINVDCDVANYSFYYMFQNCSRITSISLNFTNTVAMATSACEGMFLGCTSLESAYYEELPDYVATNCYKKMFEGCTSLTRGPVLKARYIDRTKSGSSCSGSYNRMFYGCTELDYIKTYQYQIGTNYTEDWVYGVNSSGTFVLYEDSPISYTRGSSYIPNNFTISTFGD